MIKMKISIVGPIKQNAKQGKTNPKIFLYQEAFERMGYETKLFTTSVSKIKFISLLKSILDSLKYGDSIVLMLGGNASRKLIGIFLFLNKKFKKRLILCPFGIGPLNPILKNKNIEFVNSFINNCYFDGIKDIKMQRKLAKLNLVVVQNDILKKCFENFYQLNNVFVLNNFRIQENNLIKQHYAEQSIVFVSRVIEEKGIMDLVDVIKSINDEGSKNAITLHIYGEMHLREQNRIVFYNSLDNYIQYFGPIPNSEVQKTISLYALSCLPTKYVGEGTPGFLIESLIVGVPPIVSSFTQVNAIIQNGINGLVFKINNKEDLKNKILSVIYDDKKIQKLKRQAQAFGEKYTFEYNIGAIRKMIEGLE